MALDEAIADASVAGRTVPTLRMYEWEPPCLSLGRNQPVAEIDEKRCVARGYDVVRRATGGRAILHIDELTYSVSGPATEPRLRGGILEVYQRVCSGLLSGLELLGVTAQETPLTIRSVGEESAACFEAPAAHEITVAGRKLVGSAQCRKAGWVLQHGSIPLLGDITRIVDVLAFEQEVDRRSLRSSLSQRATSLQQVLGREVSAAAAAAALVRGFGTALNLDLVPGVISGWEKDRAAELCKTKYAIREWTHHR